jgi:PAS domain S-box-containing protein
MAAILWRSENEYTRYGYPHEELLHLTIHHLAVPDLWERIPLRWQQVLAEGGTFEWRHRRKDGSEFPVWISVQPIDLAGERRVLACVRDIPTACRRGKRSPA